MKVVIQDTSQIWQSKDGSRRIFNVTYTNAAGTLLTRKTFSDDIGTGKGREFDLDEYSRDGKNGPEIFVKQIPQQQPGFGAQPQPATAASGQSSASTTQYKADPDKQSSIERQAALKVAVEVVRDYNNQYGGPDDPTPSLAQYSKDVAERGQFFASVLSGAPTEAAAAFPGAQLVNPNDYPADDNQPPASSYTQPPVQDSMV